MEIKKYKRVFRATVNSKINSTTIINKKTSSKEYKSYDIMRYLKFC